MQSLCYACSINTSIIGKKKYLLFIENKILQVVFLYQCQISIRGHLNNELRGKYDEAFTLLSLFNSFGLRASW